MSFHGIITGKTVLRIEGAMPLSFIGEIRKLFAVWDIESMGEFCCEISVKRRDFASVKKRAEKLGFKVSAVKSTGLFCFFERVFKRPGLTLGLALLIMCVYVSSLFVWDINIFGNDKVSDDDIKQGLEKIGLYEGVLKSRIDPGSVRNRYIISDSRISWMSVILYGTTANVEVIESQTPPKTDDEAEICNIVAERDGIIERVDAVRGQSVVEPGQIVSKGELVVSAVIKTRKENELMTGAKGSVFARTQRCFEVRVPMLEYRKKYTENKSVKYSVVLMGSIFTIPSFSRLDGTVYECRSETNSPRIFGKIQLPFDIKKETFSCYEREKLEISPSDARKKAEAKLDLLIESEIGSAPVLNKELSFKVSDGYGVLTCNLECIENIAKSVPVTFSS